MLRSTVSAADSNTLCMNIALSFPYSIIMETIIYLQLKKAKQIDGMKINNAPFQKEYSNNQNSQSTTNI